MKVVIVFVVVGVVVAIEYYMYLEHDGGELASGVGPLQIDFSTNANSRSTFKFCLFHGWLFFN